VDNEEDDDDEPRRPNANDESADSIVVAPPEPRTPGGSLKPSCAPVLVSSNSNGFRVWRMTRESDFDENGILYFIGR
jgi:hypothetical protein